MSVAILVAVSIANTTACHSKIMALQDAFNDITQTCFIQAVTDAMRTVGLQVQETLKTVLHAEVHKNRTTSYPTLMENHQFWKNMIPLKDDFQTINFTSTVCQVLQNLLTISASFDRKLLAALLAKDKRGQATPEAGQDTGDILYNDATTQFQVWAQCRDIAKSKGSHIATATVCGFPL
ncbi:hypothetical protein F5146DRAFT_1005986 [Armillaria mellea]|nr:hypothetical protein F5146DRAFT_1005986 [Armillaria mellea]